MADGAAEGIESEAGGNDEEFDDGMFVPQDLQVTHFEENEGYHSDSGESKATSGLEDCEDGVSAEECEEEIVGNLAPPVHGPLGAKFKAYHTSPEWIQLEKMGKEKGMDLLKMPSVLGAGLGRHPSKSFWSVRYPGTPSKAVSWGGSTGRTPVEALAKVLKFLLKHHTGVEAHEAHNWKSQIAELEKLG